MRVLLGNRNFLFLLLGRIVTNIGDSIYYVAAMWLVYDLGGSAFYSGLAGFLTLLPMSLQFLTGPFIDRWALKKTLVISQLAQCVLILVIPISYSMDLLSVQLVLIVMPIVALIEQFAYPAQTKALPLLLAKADLVKGNSYFAFAYQGVDLVFNALAGILVAVLGAITLYLADSVTFAIAAMLFSLVNLPQKAAKQDQVEKEVKLKFKSYLTDLKEGLSIFFHSLLASFLIGSIIANFAIGAAMAILPAFSDLRGESEIYGLFLAAMSTGSLIGALLASFVGKFKVGIFSIISFTIGAGCWFISAFIPSNFLAIFVYGIAWIPVGATNVIFGSVVQTVVPNRILGRVNSVSMSMSTIAMPIGSLAGGYAASTFNSQLAFACTALGMLCVPIVLLLHPELRKLPKTEDMGPETFHLQAEEEASS